ncbi:MAG: zinc carboxypeptidase, partial [Bacteroidetes bacterium]
MPQRRLFAFALLCILALPASGQDRLLAPADFLGYEPGTRFTPHHRVVAYFEHVAAASPNVRLEYYGETYEGRPLLVAYVARPDYLARLDAIRTNNLRLAGLAEGAVDGPTAALVWLSYNVHGNEAVSTEAALLTLYDLANPDNARTQAWLDSTVVIIDPCINPDGRDRYVHWYNQTVGRFPDPNPDAREHHEPWPGGRTNHYYFDLNRDWAWATQQETRHRLPLYQRWLPHVHVDFHEQGVDEPYYFAPAAEPFHEAITPWQRELQTIIGQNHARYFDERGWLYFTRQVFDLFYPGYGDTWPTFNGAVGMTYEQGGSGRAGLAIRTAEGDTLTLAERIAHHHTTGLSTVEATARHRTRVLAA